MRTVSDGHRRRVIPCSRGSRCRSWRWWAGAIAFAVVWSLGSANPFTPAGYVGYLTKGAVMGQSHFYGIQRGPTSPGRTWLVEVTNVSVTPYTYTEDFSRDDAVLSRDNLKIAFQVHTVWHVDDSADAAVHGSIQYDREPQHGSRRSLTRS